MMEWSRIEVQKKLEFEEQIAPLRESYENEIKNKDALNEEARAKLRETEERIVTMKEVHERQLQQLASNRTVVWEGRVRHWTENVKDFGRGVRDVGVGVGTAVATTAAAISACSIM